MKKDVVISDIKGERDEEISSDLFNIQSWGADLSFRELITRYDDEELVKPELQRHYVWDKTEASRFIDSLLLGLPVPSIFLSRTTDEKLLIIDGYQRIMTVYDYTKGIWREDGKVFKLSNTKKIHKTWRGKAFSELDDTLQRKIKNTTIHAIVFEQKAPVDNSNSLFLIFERINTSGRSLNSQEIRNCIYQGALNKSIIELNKNVHWRQLFGSEVPDPRMRDVEQLTRVLSFFINKIESEKREAIQLKGYLNDYMDKNSNNPLEDEIKLKISNTFQWLNQNLTNNAFRTYNFKIGKYNNKFHPPLFDAFVLACLNKMTGVEILPDNPSAEQRKHELLQNKSFSNAISIRTTNIANIRLRIQLAENLLFKE